MGSEVDAVGRWGERRLLNGVTPAVCRSHPSHRGQIELEVDHIVHVEGRNIGYEAVGADAHLRQAANQVVLQQELTHEESVNAKTFKLTISEHYNSIINDERQAGGQTVTPGC